MLITGTAIISSEGSCAQCPLPLAPTPLRSRQRAAGLLAPGSGKIELSAIYRDVLPDNNAARRSRVPPCRS